MTALLHYWVLYALVHGMGWGSTLASSLGFVIAVAFNYLMHYYWTFSRGGGDGPAPHGRALARYACMITGGFLLNALTMQLLTGLLQWHYLLAQLPAYAVIITWNFILANRWVFRS